MVRAKGSLLAFLSLGLLLGPASCGGKSGSAGGGEPASISLPAPPT